MREKTKLLLINILIISILLKTSFVFSKYIYYPIVLLTFFYTLYYIRFDLKKVFYSFKSLLIIIIQVLFFIIAFINTSTLDLGLVKEVFNIVIVVLIGFILISSINGIKELENFYCNFIRVVIYSSFTIATAGIIKFLLDIKGIDLPIYSNNEYPFGTSLQPDYNFFSLVSIVGIVFIIYNIIKQKTRIGNRFQQFALFCLAFSAFLTGSRRSIIILFGIICFLVLLLLQKKESSSKVFFRNLASGSLKPIKHFLISFFLVLLTVVLSLNFIKPESKIMISNFFGLKLSKCQYYSTTLLYRFQSVIGAKDYSDIFSRLWHGSFNSKVPQSGWGNGDYSIINNLDSCGLKDLPVDAKGIMLDKSANYIYWGLNSYYFSHIIRQKLKSNSRYIFNINCYISTDYDGNDVSLVAGSPGSPRKYVSYDLRKKGTWQKLSLDCFGDNSTENIYISFSKDSVANFSSLKGYILFAYPSTETVIVDPDDPKTWATVKFKEVYPLTGDFAEIVPSESKGCLLDSTTFVYKISNPSSKYAYSYITFGDSLIQKGDNVLSDVFCYVSLEYNGNAVMLMTENGIQASNYDLSSKGKWQKLSILVPGNNAKIPVLLYFAKFGVTDFKLLNGYVIYAHPTYRIIHSGILNKKDLSFTKKAYLSHFSAGLVKLNEYYHLADNDRSKNHETGDHYDSPGFKLNYTQDDFAGPRYDYWRFGWHIFKNEYSLSQKILGKGFDYMGQFGEEFSPKSKGLDWPHNPFISVLLYGGIVGLIAFLWLLTVTVYLYWFYRREIWPFFICFGIVFFFSFFSANNPFDPPIMGFFVILPFFIHSIHKKDNQKDKVIKSEF